MIAAALGALKYRIQKGAGFAPTRTVALSFLCWLSPTKNVIPAFFKARAMRRAAGSSVWNTTSPIQTSPVGNSLPSGVQCASIRTLKISLAYKPDSPSVIDCSTKDPGSRESSSTRTLCCSSDIRRPAILVRISKFSCSNTAARWFAMAAISFALAASFFAFSDSACACANCSAACNLYSSSDLSAAAASRLCEITEPAVATPIAVAARAAIITDTINQKSQNSPSWPRNSVEFAAAALGIVSAISFVLLACLLLIVVASYKKGSHAKQPPSGAPLNVQKWGAHE